MNSSSIFSYHSLLIREIGGVRVHGDPVAMRFGDDRTVNLGQQLLHAAAGVVAFIHPELDLRNVLGRDLADGRDGLLGRGDLTDGVQRVGPLDQNRIRSTTGRR